jgi:hypothetical protein
VRRQHVGHLVGEHRRRRLGVLDRERAAEAAALVGGGQLHQVEASGGAQQLQRPVADPQQPQGVAGRVVGDPPGDGGLLVVDRGDAGSRRRDDRLRAGEGPQVVGHDGHGLAAVAGVDVHLPAAGLPAGTTTSWPRARQQGGGSDADHAGSRPGPGGMLLWIVKPSWQVAEW